MGHSARSMNADGWTVYGELVARDWDTLTDSQLALVAIGELRSEVNNGGFDQYFFNSGGDLAPTARATASDAGVTALVNLLDRAMAAVGSPFKIDRNERQAALAAVSAHEAFDSLDREFCDLETSVNLDTLMNSLAGNA